jgi:hypothetical protein
MGGALVIFFRHAKLGQELIGQRLGFGQRIRPTFSEIGAGHLDCRQLVALERTRQVIVEQGQAGE